MARMREFAAVEEAMAGPLAEAIEEGVRAELSPVFKAPRELHRGSLLFLDMTDQARILFDRDAVLADYLAGL